MQKGSRGESVQESVNKPILLGLTTALVIGVVYLVPASYAASKRVNSKLLLIIVAAAAAVLAITLVGFQALLPITTSAFVIAVAGASAVAGAKALRRAFKMK